MAQARQQLPGYEQDINKLIDEFSVQAHHHQVISFESFKQLFQQGCYAYIHQAYWGCEHSPEYTQLLFAVALDRLDTPSPTAPQESVLWQLHQLVPKVPTSMADMHTAGSTREPAGDLPTQHTAADLTGGMPSSCEAAAADPMQVDQVAHEAEAQQMLLPAKQQQQQLHHAQFEGQTHEAEQHCQPQMQAQQGPLEHVQMQQLEQQQLEHYLDDQQHQQQPDQPLQAEQPTQQAVAGDGLLGSPLQLLHSPHHLGLEPQAAELSPSLWHLLPSPQQHQQHTGPDGGGTDLDGLDDFMLPSAAVPTGSPPQQQLGLEQQQGVQHTAGHLPQQQEQEQEQQLWQRGCAQPRHVSSAAVGPQRGQHEQPQPAQAHPLQGQQQLQQQPPLSPQQQQQRNMGLPLLQAAGEDEDEDAFLADLLAILDEATHGEEQPVAAAAAGAAGAPGPPSNLQDATDTGIPLQQAHQQQQFVLQIPLVVKGAVVFTLLALHESQLNYPKAPVYVPLPLLQQLAQASAEFKAAGAAAADVLKALHVLTAQHRLLLGQFRRPNSWEPQLPPFLMPGGRLPCGLGTNAVIGAAARKAGAAARSSMQSAAVAAAARAARGAAGFDPGVHREALFHIKTALQGFSHFRGLQSLCEAYAGARRAVFEPLLGSRAAAAAGSASSEQQAAGQSAGGLQQQGQGHAGAEAGGADDGPAGQRGLVVQRGGSRRKRRAARARSANKNTGAQEGAAGAAPTAPEPVPGQQQQQQGPPAVGASHPDQPAMDLPELFDTNFAAALQSLANNEASRMLLLLDPYYSASKVSKRAAEERRAAKVAEAAAAEAARQKLNRFQQLTMASASAAAAGQRNPQQELVAAGVFTEQQIEDVGPNLGSSMGSALTGGAQQVLRRAAQQRQVAVQVAQEWLRADMAMVVDDGDDADEDMP